MGSSDKGTLILIRHGQSMWNMHNLFTGWVDVPLSEKGINEALAAGDKIKDLSFGLIYTSTLVRALQTALIAMAKNTEQKTPIISEVLDNDFKDWNKIYSETTTSASIPVFKHWQLNERYYGELQGMNKKETAEKYGDDQVHIWRRSYDVPPPNGEALKNTAERTIPFFKEEIEPKLKEGQNILVSAHGNSLRSIVMYLDNLSEEEVLKLEIATGDPIRYQASDSCLVKAAI